MPQSDPKKIIRYLPIFIGGLGALLLLVNRLTTPEITSSQARGDILGVVLSAVLILTGLIWQQVQPKTPNAVQLIGNKGFEMLPELPQAVKTELAWASHLLLTNTVTQSLLILFQGQVLLRRGILGPRSDVETGSILNRVLQTEKPIYLVDLNIYPGRVEFGFLPDNTQGIICQPIGNKGVLILGANAPRSYTKQDERWIAGIADKLAVTLNIIDSI
ncbi:expressed protein [Richelia intracellularis HM01]|uniref:cofactor assembly of complex C subunit B n=1 Tax=Richelia intracellularis TaxID=1164990 RepID=UPI0002B518E1|nr:cofactor assembly of complex C subunit B [Richelia intracellularis]CCH65233.1 expressed protein [Richelia intracellularis HM01]